MLVEPSPILLVEDDPNDVKLMKLALREYNLVEELIVAEDGEQALQYLHGELNSPFIHTLPRLVLLDLKLPKINGIEVLQAIRNHSDTRHLVVVMMSSSAEDRDLEAAYSLGVNSYIIKPLDFQQFINVSRQVVFYWMMLNQIPPSLC